MRFFLTFLLLALVGGASLAQSPAKRADELPPIYFRSGETSVAVDYKDNRRALTQWDRLFSDLGLMPLLDSLYVVGSTSPDGGDRVNSEVARARADHMRTYLLRRYPSLDPRRVVSVVRVGLWSDLADWVRLDPEVPKQEEVLAILTLPIPDASKYTQLRSLAYGAPYDYLVRRVFPTLRYVLLEATNRTPQVAKSNLSDVPVAAPEAKPVSDSVSDSEQRVSWSYSAGTVGFERVQKPLFALKTNLLFDLATVLNLELEVPLGRRWSVAVEGMFPWWLWDSKQYRLQLISGHLEGRYWLGDRQKQAPLTGWFAGLYGGWGYYDVEWGSRGIQGQFCDAGLSGGYAHAIHKSGNLRLEYSLGLGYLRSPYHDYVPYRDSQGNWQTLCQQEGVYTWIGPTRAKVSLVWVLNKNVTIKKK